MRSFSRSDGKTLAVVLIGIFAGLAISTAIPQASAASDITQLMQQIRTIVLDIQAKVNALTTGATTNTNTILDKVDDQDQYISVSGVANGQNINLQLVPPKEDAYGTKIHAAFSITPDSDINNDGQLNVSDCDATLGFFADFDNDGSPNQSATFGAPTSGTWNAATSSGEYYDGISLAISAVGTTDSCAYTVVMTLDVTPQ